MCGDAPALHGGWLTSRTKGQLLKVMHDAYSLKLLYRHQFTWKVYLASFLGAVVAFPAAHMLHTISSTELCAACLLQFDKVKFLVWFFHLDLCLLGLPLVP